MGIRSARLTLNQQPLCQQSGHCGAFLSYRREAHRPDSTKRERRMCQRRLPASLRCAVEIVIMLCSEVTRQTSNLFGHSHEDFGEIVAPRPGNGLNFDFSPGCQLGMARKHHDAIFHLASKSQGLNYSDFTLRTIAAESIPYLASNSSGLPEWGSSRTASLCTLIPSALNSPATASPRPPSG